MCVIGSANSANAYNFGGLFAQNYTNYHLVIIGKVDENFLQFSKNQANIKIDNPIWDIYKGGYYGFKDILLKYCG